MKVRYFDLGCNQGNTVKKAMAQLKGRCELEIHAVEANPKLAELCRQRFAGSGFVHVHNFAVAKEKGKVNLHLSTDHSLAGSSLFADKNNVGKAEVSVDGMPFSEFFASLGEWDGLNVLKANIEGAEMILVDDLARHDLFSRFCLLLGSNRKGGWTQDMFKIPSLAGHIERVAGEMSRRGLVVKTFCGGDRDVNLWDELSRIAGGAR
jgi:FkbM family methyltransferase